VARALQENPKLRLEMPRGENDNMLAEVFSSSSPLLSLQVLAGP